jgi:hypothetical protein
MTRRAASAILLGGALVALACGDVTSDLITGDGSGGSSSGGSAGGGSAGLGGSSTSGSAGALAGGGGSGGTPECTTNDDCNDSERIYCDVMRGMCVECINRGACEIDEDCNVAIGECGRPCTSSTDCIEPDDPYCHELDHFCVECLENEDCPEGEQCARFQCSD